MSDETTKTDFPISKSELGRLRKKWDTLKDMVSADELKATQILDIKVVNKQRGTKVTLDAVTAEIEKMRKESGLGKREADKQEREAIILMHAEYEGVGNVAGQSERGEVKLDTAQKAQLFDQLGKLHNALTMKLIDAFDGYGAIIMSFPPRCINAESPLGLAPHVGGWDDNSPNPRYQYADRKRPVSKRSGYREDSFKVLFADIPTVKSK